MGLPEAEAQLMVFVPTVDIDRSMHFYSEVLGLPVSGGGDGYYKLNAGQASIRLTLIASPNPSPSTLIGWQVEDIESIAADLAERGASFERYEGIEQDERCVWTPPTGDRVAWFEDPDENILSLTQFNGTVTPGQSNDESVDLQALT